MSSDLLITFGLVREGTALVREDTNQGDRKVMIKPSFITAYQLEQTHAKTSRIIISSRLNLNLAKIFSQATTFWNDELLRVLRKDIDGFVILNPHTLYSSVEDKEHVIKLISKLRDDTKGANKEKYSPLLACLNTAEFDLKEGNLGKY